MKDKLSDEQNEAILKALNDAIEKGPWGQSNFLKVIGKNLIEIRDGFLNQLGASSQAQLKAESHLANRIALRSGQQEVYVSLYSTDGINLQSWERIVANLPRQMISRPIYADEEDIKAALKIKENKPLMEDQNIGAHCDICQRLDYCPYYCQTCQSNLCEEHYHNEFSCSKYVPKETKEFKKIDTVSLICSFCKVSLKTFQNRNYKCDKCEYDFCDKHRLDFDHECPKQKKSLKEQFKAGKEKMKERLAALKSGAKA